MNIQIEKAFIIEQLKHIEDVDLIHAIKSLLKYSSKKEDAHDFIIPEWQKEIVLKRRAEMEAHPDKSLSWDDIMEELDS